MPPRTAKSPGSTTVPVREKPFCCRKASNSSISARGCPGAAVKVAAAIALRGGTRCNTALTVVSTMRGPAGCRLSSRDSVASRRATTVGAGDTRS